MKSLSLFTILFCLSFMNKPDVTHKKEIISVFAHTKHVNSDGKPSRFDGDYIIKTLYLYEGFSFDYSFQQGRLEPKIEMKSGS